MRPTLTYAQTYSSTEFVVEELKTKIQNIILNVHQNSIQKATRNEFSHQSFISMNQNLTGRQLGQLIIACVQSIPIQLLFLC